MVEPQIASPRQPIGRYTRVAVALHWLIAGFILFNLAVGWFMEGFPPALKGIVLPLHVSCGISVLALSAVRIGWRLIHQPPPFDPVMTERETQAAHIVHFLLYAGMLLMPLTGWAILSSHPAPGTAGAAADAAAHPPPATPPGTTPPPKGGGLKIWYLVPLPAIAAIQEVGATPGGLPPQRVLHDRFVTWHAVGGYLMIALALLHVAGALKHHLLDGRRTLWRMTWAGGRHRGSAA